MPALTYSCRKAPRRQPGLRPYPTDESLSIVDLCLHNICTAEGFGIYPRYICNKTSDWGSSPPPFLISVSGKSTNDAYPTMDKTLDCCMLGSDSASAPQLRTIITTKVNQSIWRYSSNRALPSPSFLLQSSLLSFISLQFLNPSKWFASFVTTSSHLFLDLSSDLVL